MPFDFCRYKHYKIDYENLFDELNSKEILNDKRIQTELLEVWVEQLKSADKILSNQLKTRESIKELKLLHQEEPEIFQLPLHFQKNEIFLHFRVSLINKIITAADREKAEYLPIDEFDKKRGTIYWTQVEGDVGSYSTATAPILLVPFLSGQYNCLVIDGNHRLTSKFKNNIDDIHGLLISEQTVIEINLMASGFDKLYYIMNNELAHMAHETHIKNTEALELSHNSYLKAGRLMF